MGFFYILLSALILSGPKNILPEPVKYEVKENYYCLNGNITYKIESYDFERKEKLIDQINESFPKLINVSSSPNIHIFIEGKRFKNKLKINSCPDNLINEGYKLEINKKGIIIRSKDIQGAYYALISIDQMLLFSSNLQYCNILDYPRYGYRGMMLDLSRHFSSADFIKKQINMMSSLKMNKLHLHLTDDAGWRIQIDKYPRLKTYSAWRIGKTWKEWYNTTKSYAEEGTPGAYGGYLTKDEIKDLVKYASKRNIEIIPEIEIPGHSRELIMAYPQIACRTNKSDLKTMIESSDVCPGNEETYTMFSNILSEIAELFPSKYIHIGGDEAVKSSWKNCAICKERVREQGFNSIDELQGYCINRIYNIAHSLGKKIIGWDEMLDSKIPDDVTIMAWRGIESAQKAINTGHKVIFTPTSHCYLDYTQDPQFKEPESIGGYTPLEKCYSLEPEQNNSDRQYILGVQGNLWREFIPTDEYSEYMLYPRIYALAEVGWSPKGTKNYTAFRHRANDFRKKMKERGYNSFDMDTELGNRPEYFQVTEHLAKGKKVIFNTAYEDKYSGSGEGTLTDGLFGGCNHADGRWLGFLNKDVELTVDLGSVQELHYIGSSFLGAKNVWIGRPEKVEIFVSDNGQNFKPILTILDEIPEPVEKQIFINYGGVVNTSARFVKYKAYRRKAKLYNDWLFLDELIVN